MNVRAPFEPADAVALLQMDAARRVAHEVSRWAASDIRETLELDEAQVGRAVEQMVRGMSLFVTAERRHRADTRHLMPCRHELVNNDLPELEHHERRRARSAHPPRPGADASTPRTPHGPPRRAAHLTALVGVIAKGEKPPP